MIDWNLALGTIGILIAAASLIFQIMDFFRKKK